MHSGRTTILLRVEETGTLENNGREIFVVDIGRFILNVQFILIMHHLCICTCMYIVYMYIGYLEYFRGIM